MSNTILSIRNISLSLFAIDLLLLLLLSCSLCDPCVVVTTLWFGKMMRPVLSMADSQNHEGYHG